MSIKEFTGSCVAPESDIEIDMLQAMLAKSGERCTELERHLRACLIQLQASGFILGGAITQDEIEARAYLDGLAKRPQDQIDPRYLAKSRRGEV